MIDIDALKLDKRPQSAWVVHALIDRLEAAEKERDALRAKVEQMEKQEPVGKIVAFGESLHEPSWRAGRLPPLMTELYTLPGAQAQPAPSVPDGWETDLLIVEHAMRMNNWDWNSDTSDDLKRSAYKIISKLLAAPEAKP